MKLVSQLLNLSRNLTPQNQLTANSVPSIPKRQPMYLETAETKRPRERSDCFYQSLAKATTLNLHPCGDPLTIVCYASAITSNQDTNLCYSIQLECTAKSFLQSVISNPIQI